MTNFGPSRSKAANNCSVATNQIIRSRHKNILLSSFRFSFSTMYNLLGSNKASFSLNKSCNKCNEI